MTPISRLLRKFSRRLFTTELEQTRFLDALSNPQPFHPCILWCQEKVSPAPFQSEPALPWQPAFVDRLALNARPGQHPLHQQGYFYCLDFSSVFAASAIAIVNSPVQNVLDICAAPGGKSIFAWTLLKPEMLFANETIGKRIGMLKGNFSRCNIQPSTILNLDSSLLAERFKNTISVAIVDAPCTGQSLLAKGQKVPGCFHPVAINKNSNRQKRILANAAKTVAPEGYLAYMTCAYSIEENEQVCTWLIDRFPNFEPVPIPHLLPYQSHLTDLPCYRMWPQDRLGAGAFTMVFQNASEI